MNRKTLNLVLGMSMAAAVIAPKAALAGDPAGFEYAFTVGKNSGAFGTKSNLQIGGTLSVPIFGADPLFGQLLLGEVNLGYSQTEDNGIFTAPDVTGLGLPAEPDPATRFQLTNFQVLAGIKYKFTFLPTLLGLIQIQPYIATGAGFYVLLSRTDGGNGDRAGGIAPVSPELDARGVPAGQGDVLIGVNYGGGIDFVVAKNLLIGAEFRRAEISDKGADFNTYVGKVGFRF